MSGLGENMISLLGELSLFLFSFGVLFYERAELGADLWSLDFCEKNMALRTLHNDDTDLKIIFICSRVSIHNTIKSRDML
jgi:hypothetical protein